jgi:hypothetical protein
MYAGLLEAGLLAVCVPFFYGVFLILKASDFKSTFSYFFFMLIITISLIIIKSFRYILFK